MIGSRGADFLSWREYPYQGITAMIRRAEASFAALIMMSSSNRLSLTDWRTPLNTLQVDCTRNTSAPRMLSANRHVDLAVGERLDLDLAELDVEALGDVLAEGGAGAPGEHHHAARVVAS